METFFYSILGWQPCPDYEPLAQANIGYEPAGQVYIAQGQDTAHIWTSGTASIWADGDSIFMPNLGGQEGEAFQNPTGHILWNISTP